MKGRRKISRKKSRKKNSCRSNTRRAANERQRKVNMQMRKLAQLSELPQSSTPAVAAAWDISERGWVEAQHQSEW